MVSSVLHPSNGQTTMFCAHCWILTQSYRVGNKNYCMWISHPDTFGLILPQTLLREMLGSSAQQGLPSSCLTGKGKGHLLLWHHKMITQILSAALETFPTAGWDLAGLSGNALSVVWLSLSCHSCHPGHTGGAALSRVVWVKHHPCGQERWQPRWWWSLHPWKGACTHPCEVTYPNSKLSHSTRQERWDGANSSGIWSHGTKRDGMELIQQPRGKERPSLPGLHLSLLVHTLNIKWLQF